MAGKIYRFLADDHARLDALLEHATARLDTIDDPVYAEFRAQLLKHIAMEEKILLPAERPSMGNRFRSRRNSVSSRGSSGAPCAQA